MKIKIKSHRRGNSIVKPHYRQVEQALALARHQLRQSSIQLWYQKGRIPLGAVERLSQRATNKLLGKSKKRK